HSLSFRFTRARPRSPLFPYTTLFRSRAAEVRMERLLAEQPFVLAALDADGRVQSAHGPAAPGLDPGRLPGRLLADCAEGEQKVLDRKSTRLNSSHVKISYAVFCLKKK